MFLAQIPPTERDISLGFGDSRQLVGEVQTGHSEYADASLAHEVDQALWKDAAFRAADYDSIAVHASGGIVHLYGHVSSLTNQHRAERALQNIPGLLGVNNDLIPDDRLLAEVATALGSLEHTYDCKFFTGVSHGVVLLSGEVDNATIRSLAEKCAADNPNVRGVLNSVHIRGTSVDLLDQPFLQPATGAEIFFLDGISGRVRQVIINPDNRRVVAMTIQGRFADQRQELQSLNNGEARPPERLIVLSMNLVRYLTKVSGFLDIHSNERKRYMEFDPARFVAPPKDWKAPYPYRPGDVLFRVEHRELEGQLSQQLLQSPFAVALEEQSLREQLIANDSLGG